jgi:hypothetical protein
MLEAVEGVTMTEAEWLDWSGDPCSMLDPIRDQVSKRKLRLFACACCLRIWHLLADERSRKAVEVGELFADGQVDEEELGTARAAAHAAHFEAATPAILCPAAHAAACAFYTVTFPAISTFAAANRAAACVGPKKEAEQLEQCRLCRDIFGNPFRPVAFDPAWRTPEVVAIAQAVYDGRDFGRMPDLADALKDAGCTNPDILSHCRNGGEHVRGYWPIDLLLGRA